MKKLALVLGSLLVVGAVSQAKEIMPAPVVVEEVKVVGFRPNGNITVEYENKHNNWEKLTKATVDGKDVTTDEAKKLKFNTKATKTKLTTKGKVEFIKNHTLNFKATAEDASLRFDRLFKDGERKLTNAAKDYELGYTYAYGPIADNFKMDLGASYNSKEDLSFRAKFSTIESLFSNDFITKTSFSMEPKYTVALRHVSKIKDVKDFKNQEMIASSHKFQVKNELKLDLVYDVKVKMELTPFFDVVGINSENIYNIGKDTFFEDDIKGLMTGLPYATDKRESAKVYGVKFKAMAEKEFSLYNENNLEITAGIEAGLGNLTYSRSKIDLKDTKLSGSLFAFDLEATPSVKADYKLSEAANVYAQFETGFAYGYASITGKVDNKDEVKAKAAGFGIKPKTTVGFKVKF